MDAQQLDTIRQTVLSTLASLGMPKAQWSLVTDAHSPRRRERVNEDLPSGRVRVVWQTDRQQLEFFDERGRLLTTASLAEPPERGAA